MARWVLRRGSVRILVALLAFPVAIVGVLWIESRVDHEQKAVYDLYVEALADRDLDLAWALGCRSDREVVDRVAFEERYDAAVAELGGEITSWRRLRSGAEWQGPAGSLMARPALTE